MKKALLSAIVAVVAIFAAAPQASAQFHFGPKLGVCLNEMRFSDKIFSSDNRAGFTGGIMAEFTVPLIGVGADVSVLYVRRNSQWINEKLSTDNTTNVVTDYIDIPLNLKYKLSIPVISKFLKPFVTTGPDFAFRCGKETVKNVVKRQGFDFAWNFGFGFEVMSRVQLAASYGLGLTKAYKWVNSDGSTANIDGKNSYWTVTAAYLF